MTFEEYFQEKYGTIKPHIQLVTRAIAEDAWNAAKKGTGYCTEGDYCCCGGDLPAIRQGCACWRGEA